MTRYATFTNHRLAQTIVREIEARQVMTRNLNDPIICLDRATKPIHQPITTHPMLVSDRAICLRRFEYSETSQIVTLFTRQHGLFKTIAKGAHRMTKAGQSRFDGGVDLLDEAVALFTSHVDRELNTLAEWKITHGRRQIRSNLRAIYLCLYLAELVSELFELHDAHPSLFDRLSSTLDRLGGGQIEAHAMACTIDILRQAGVMPRIAYCAVCNAPVLNQTSITNSPEHGGALCFNCETALTERYRIDGPILQLAAAIWRLPRIDGEVENLPAVSIGQSTPFHSMLVRHIQHTTGRSLRTARYILECPTEA